METSEAPVVKKQPLIDKVGTAAHKILTPERTPEFLSSSIMWGIELYHESILNPNRSLDKYLHLTTHTDQMPSLPTDPAARWAVDHIGDIWEISAGFMAMRMGFVAVNEVLKKEPIKKLTNGYQVSDEAAFWTSLITTVTVKAGHSLGYYSLFGIHDHMAHPVPEMIFGQGVAAVVLAASHYAGKYHESIKDLAEKGMRSIFSDKKSNVTPNVAVNVSDQIKE